MSKSNQQLLEEITIFQNEMKSYYPIAKQEQDNLKAFYFKMLNFGQKMKLMKKFSIYSQDAVTSIFQQICSLYQNIDNQIYMIREIEKQEIKENGKEINNTNLQMEFEQIKENYNDFLRIRHENSQFQPLIAELQIQQAYEEAILKDILPEK